MVWVETRTQPHIIRNPNIQPTHPYRPQALVYHNIVPVISYRLKGNAAQIRTAIVAGSGIPLLLFLVGRNCRVGVWVGGCVFMTEGTRACNLVFVHTHTNTN